jgi:hypothetical protein
MRLTQHAMEKCQAYGIQASSLLETLQTSEAFRFFGKPWVAVLNPESDNAGVRRSGQKGLAAAWQPTKT